MTIADDIKYIGVDDLDIDIFEGQYPVKDGMSYNSYVILDGKIAVLDTVDGSFIDEWLDKLKAVLDSRKPDYLIIQHMEPDHSAGIARFMEEYPDAVIVSSMMAFNIMKGYFNTDYADRRIISKEGDTLSLGRHTLSFVAAPMVNWPEVMLTYDTTDKILFSADAFGQFGALSRSGLNIDEARRYYIGIVGKFGLQVEALLKKAADIEIKAVCPLHGPVLTDELPLLLDHYKLWAGYESECDDCIIAYTSVYGHTAQIAEMLASELESRGHRALVYDLARTDHSIVLAEAFRADTLILASTTYNTGVFPAMRSFIDTLVEHGYKNRTVGIIENGSWAPTAAKVMKAKFENSQGIRFLENSITLKGGVSSENIEAIKAMADEICS